MIKSSIFLLRRTATINSTFLPLTVNDPVGGSETPCMRVSVPRVPFSPGVGYCILDAERTVMQPAARKQRAGGRSVGRSLLAPRFPLACPRVILHATGAPRRRRQRRSYKVEPSATIDGYMRVGCCENTGFYLGCDEL